MLCVLNGLVLQDFAGTQLATFAQSTANIQCIYMLTNPSISLCSLYALEFSFARGQFPEILENRCIDKWKDHNTQQHTAKHQEVFEHIDI